jgi:hypothetical protein
VRVINSPQQSHTVLRQVANACGMTLVRYGRVTDWSCLSQAHLRNINLLGRFAYFLGDEKRAAARCGAWRQSHPFSTDLSTGAGDRPDLAVGSTS